MEKPVRRLAASALAALAFVLMGAPASSQAASPVKHVAMGDSYSSASGVAPFDPTGVSCTRSLVNYPHDIAAATGAQLTDVSCGAAQTKDFFESQQPGVAPQLDAVQKDTPLVTMTIGGNDSGVFINSIVECGIAGASTAGQGSPCKDRYGSSFQDTIRTTTYPSLVKALKAVHARAPHAKVAILGYPWILPQTVGCFD